MKQAWRGQKSLGFRMGLRVDYSNLQQQVEIPLTTVETTHLKCYIINGLKGSIIQHIFQASQL